LNMEASALRARLNNLSEQNPMLGHRGCRLAISFPEIAEMQALAIFGSFEFGVGSGR
jgi:pyruvate,orthophosphate dikinase